MGGHSHQSPSSSGLGASSGSSSSKYLSSSSRATMSRLSKSGLLSTVLRGEGGCQGLVLWASLLLTLQRSWGSPGQRPHAGSCQWELPPGGEGQAWNLSGLQTKGNIFQSRDFTQKLKVSLKKLEDGGMGRPSFPKKWFSNRKILALRGHVGTTRDVLGVSSGVSYWHRVAQHQGCLYYHAQVNAPHKERSAEKCLP